MDYVVVFVFPGSISVNVEEALGYLDNRLAFLEAGHRYNPIFLVWKDASWLEQENTASLTSSTSASSVGAVFVLPTGLVLLEPQTLNW